MISGLYIGEIAGRILFRLARDVGLFGGKVRLQHASLPHIDCRARRLHRRIRHVILIFSSALTSQVSKALPMCGGFAMMALHLLNQYLIVNIVLFLFCPQVPEALLMRDGFTTADLAAIDDDDVDPWLHKTGDVLCTRLGLQPKDVPHSVRQTVIFCAAVRSYLKTNCIWLPTATA